jgi:hypothetical protein
VSPQSEPANDAVPALCHFAISAEAGAASTSAAISVVARIAPDHFLIHASIHRCGAPRRQFAIHASTVRETEQAFGANVGRLNGIGPAIVALGPRS